MIATAAPPAVRPVAWPEPDAVLRPFAEYAVGVIGAVAVLIALWGVFVSLIQLVRVERARLSGRDPSGESERLRRSLGFYMLLTLNFLVAADIIETLVHPTVQHLTVLGGVMLIRIVLSITLIHELRSKPEEAVASGAGPQHGARTCV